MPPVGVRDKIWKRFPVCGLRAGGSWDFLRGRRRLIDCAIVEVAISVAMMTPSRTRKPARLHKQRSLLQTMILSIRRALSRPNFARLNNVNRQSSHSIKNQVDPCGIPVQPTWSVHQLLESYACPKLSSTTIDRLYELSALAPPNKDTLQYEKMKKDLEVMVKLVEAVKQVNTNGVPLVGRGEKEDGDRIQQNSQFEENGQTLLKYAARTENKFYAVDAERKR